MTGSSTPPTGSRAELAEWWWSLTEEQRVAKRKAFMHKYHTDPVFLSQVRRLIWEEEKEKRESPS